MPAPLRAMQPGDFVVNRTWLAFRMNRLPFLVDGEQSDAFVLQDAASMFIFGSTFAPHGAECPAAGDASALLKQAWARRQEWPAELVLPGRPSTTNTFALAARERGLRVRAVAEARMSFYIIDVQSSFEEYASRPGAGE